MPRRRSSQWLLLLPALAASLPARMVLAQDQKTGGPAPSSSAGAPTAPGAPAPTITPSRPALVPASPPSPSPPPAAPTAAAAAINPARDQTDLAAQGTLRPAGGELAGAPQDVFSDDWWGKARPVIEVHGYFRTRAQLFQNLSLGRHGSYLQGNDPQFFAPIPVDQAYTPVSNGQPIGAALCGSPNPNGGAATGNCNIKTETTANVRLRIDPEIDISDNLRIQTEIFALDNLVLGSTPNAYAIQPANGTTMNARTGYVSAGYNRFAPLSFFSTTQGPPTAGVNGSTNSIEVQRVWAEYNTPLGQLRFGRMPGNWGLGMVENAGDGIDSDYQTTLDRIMFVTGLKSMDLYFGGAWDFPSSGPTTGPSNGTSAAFDVYGGQPYNICNLCNVNEWAAFVAHRTNAEIQRLKLARGDLVINGGVYTTFRSQYLDVTTGTTGTTPYTDDYSSPTTSLESRRAWALTPDLWVQLLWRKLRFEAEAATINGQIGSYPTLSSNLLNPVNIREYGLVTQTEFRAVDDKLDLQFGFGWASGDPYANNPSPGNGSGVGALSPGPNGLQGEFANANNQVADISTFRFHPDYHVDLIFFRNILQQIEGAYYFRPSIDYDFLRHADGEKLGGGAAVIWSRASEFVQAPGHRRDLGVELDARLYYQSKDGSLNDDPSKIGGFFAMLQYGVFFPLAGLDYLPGETVNLTSASLSAAQTLRLFLGVIY